MVPYSIMANCILIYVLPFVCYMTLGKLLNLIVLGFVDLYNGIILLLTSVD